MDGIRGIRSLSDADVSWSDDVMMTGNDMKKVRSLMERYDSSLLEWKRYAFYDSKTNYTRNLIATDQKTFTLMQLCWNPSKWR